MNAPDLQTLQRQCDEWNENHEVRTFVRVRMDNGDIRETRTRSAAEILGGHSAVIWLDGISGCYLLNRVTAI